VASHSSSNFFTTLSPRSRPSSTSFRKFRAVNSSSCSTVSPPMLKQSLKLCSRIRTSSLRSYRNLRYFLYTRYATHLSTPLILIHIFHLSSRSTKTEFLTELEFWYPLANSKILSRSFNRFSHNSTTHLGLLMPILEFQSFRTGKTVPVSYLSFSLKDICP